MRRRLGDLIWGQSTNGNSVGQILAQLKRDIALLRSRPVKVAALEEISPDLGTITAGRFIASSDSDPLTIIDSDTEGNAPTVTGSGVVIDGDGIPVANGGDKAGIIGYGASSVVGFYDTVAGKRVSGQGAVVQDENGITLEQGTGGPNSIKIVSTSTPMTVALINGYTTGATPNRQANIQLRASAEEGGTGKAVAQLTARDGNSLQNALTVETVPPYLHLLNVITGMDDDVHLGDYAGYELAPDDTNDNSLYTRTATGNSLGSNGFIRAKVVLYASNTVDATNYTVTPRIKWGGSTVFSPGTLTFSANTQRHAVAVYDITITNVGATGSQALTLNESRIVNQTAAGAAAGATPTPLLYYTTASVDTTADADLAVTVQKSSADTDLDVKLLVVIDDGPIYA